MKLAKEIITSINSIHPATPLSANEAKILEQTMVSGFLAFRDIHSEVLPGTDKANSHRSARRLVRRGYLRTVFLRGKEVFGWRLSDSLVIEYTKAINFQGMGIYRLYPRAASHDGIVRSFARYFDGVFEADWIAHEAMVRANQMSENPGNRMALDTSVPDLLFCRTVNESKVAVAIEIERTRKSGVRLNQILENRISSPLWDRVLYLLDDDLKIPKYLQHSLHVHRTSSKAILRKRSNPVLFIKRSAVLRSGLNTPGMTKDGETTLEKFLL
jgi:hypothetical protein